ncbi:hypothetical protein RCL1_005014 [Eukaryota sp. TZLM3-RCL]
MIIRPNVRLKLPYLYYGGKSVDSTSLSCHDLSLESQSFLNSLETHPCNLTASIHSPFSILPLLPSSLIPNSFSLLLLHDCPSSHISFIDYCYVELVINSLFTSNDSVSNLLFSVVKKNCGIGLFAISFYSYLHLKLVNLFDPFSISFESFQEFSKFLTENVYFKQSPESFRLFLTLVFLSKLIELMISFLFEQLISLPSSFDFFNFLQSLFNSYLLVLLRLKNLDEKLCSVFFEFNQRLLDWIDFDSVFNQQSMLPIMTFLSTIKQSMRSNLDIFDLLSSSFEFLINESLLTVINSRLLHVGASTDAILDVLVNISNFYLNNSWQIDLSKVTGSMSRHLQSKSRDDVMDQFMSLIFDQESVFWNISSNKCDVTWRSCSIIFDCFGFDFSVEPQFFPENFANFGPNVQKFNPFVAKTSSKVSLFDTICGSFGNVDIITSSYQKSLALYLFKDQIDFNKVHHEVEILKKLIGNVPRVEYLEKMIDDIEKSSRLQSNVGARSSIRVLSRHVWPSSSFSTEGSTLSRLIEPIISRIDTDFRAQNDNRILQLLPLEGHVEFSIKFDGSRVLVKGKPILYYLIKEFSQTKSYCALDFARIYQIKKEIVLEGLINLIDQSVIRPESRSVAIDYNCRFVIGRPSEQNSVQSILIDHEPADWAIYKKFILAILKTKKKGVIVSVIVGMLGMYMSGQTVDSEVVEKVLTKMVKDGSVTELLGVYCLKK